MGRIDSEITKRSVHSIVVVKSLRGSSQNPGVSTSFLKISKEVRPQPNKFIPIDGGSQLVDEILGSFCAKGANIEPKYKQGRMSYSK